MNMQADPLESQREIEALQKVVAKTSKYVHARTAEKYEQWSN